MAEYVSKSTLYALCGQRGITYLHVSDIDNMPAADVAPVVHGTWFLRHIGYGHYWECSVCHATPIYVTNNTNYCPNCGAKMDMEQEEPTNGKQHDAE